VHHDFRSFPVYDRGYGPGVRDIETERCCGAGFVDVGMVTGNDVHSLVQQLNT
jgi:hypothetical protein